MSDIIPETTPTKQCSRCKKHKPAIPEYFYFYKTKGGAINPHCIQCYKERYALEHPPKPKMPSIEGMQQCADCNEFFPATSQYFAKNAATKSGLRSDCKKCRSIRRTKHREENRDRYRAYEQSRIEKHREDCHHYLEAHREELREKSRLYARGNIEKIRHYQLAHPEQRKAHKQKRRATKRGNGGVCTAQDISSQYARQKGKCYWCSKKVPKNYHIDHVIPLSRGGSSDPSNLVIACPACNLSKGNKLPHEWPRGGKLI
jgi:5-methylcytosine-specific restriction endonuclease McrA